MKNAKMKKSDTIANKKILIFTSSGGGGHLSATSALENYLHEYEIEIVHIFKLLQHLDPIRVITGNTYSCEELFNEFLPKKYIRLLSWISRFGIEYIHRRRKRIYHDLRTYIVQSKPTLIISFIPVMNYIILDVAQELNIPFLLIPTDLDATLYVQRIKNPDYKQFYIGLSFDDEDIRKPFKKNHIAPKHIIVLGAPLKADFFIQQNKDLLKEQYNIPQNKPVIMLLMGSRGSYETEKYTQQLLKIPFPAHLLICIGQNLKSKEALQKFMIPKHITLSIIEFTPHIADYMTVSDLLISKSGTQSVCEALYKNIPLFIDAITNPLLWEKFNHTFIKKHRFGQLIKRYKQIVPLMTSLIDDSQQLMTYKHNIKKLEKHNFSTEIMILIKKIIPN